MSGGAFEHIGDGFDAAMGVIREAANWSLEWIVKGEMIEEQEGIVLVADLWSNGTAESDARAFDSVLWFNNLKDGSKLVHVRIDVASGVSFTGEGCNLRDSNKKQVI